MCKAEMMELLVTVLDLAKHGIAFSKKPQEEIVAKYLKGREDGYWPFACGWLEQDLEDIVKVLESAGVYTDDTK